MSNLRNRPTDELEFSVIAANVLKNAGYVTVGHVLDLDEATVRALPHAGVRTWLEIADVKAELAVHETANNLDDAWAKCVQAVETLNETMDQHPSLRVAVIDHGEVLVYCTSANVARRRLSR